MSPRLQVYVALLLCVGATAVAAATCDPAKSESKCFSCGAMGTCNAGTVEEGTLCPAGQACMEAYGTAFCTAVDETTCSKCTKGSIFCDPYNPENVLVCVPGITPPLTKMCAGGEKCKSGVCVPGSPPGPTPTCDDVTGLTAVYKVNTPSCRTGVLCYKGEVISPAGPCSQTQYFNPDTGLCANLPVNSCEGKGDGLFPHMTDCTKRVVCQGGVRVMDLPCDKDELVINNQCELSTDKSGCPALTDCTFESDGSINPVLPLDPTPSPELPDCTSKNLNKRYANATDCKWYNTCRQMNDNTYKMVPTPCIGNLLFNSKSTYCDLPENVPDCQLRNARLALEGPHRAPQHQASGVGFLSSGRKILLGALN